jgi:hypothetical protein
MPLPLPPASFDPSDPQPLVEAALACPMCLHASHWTAVAGPALECTCTSCDHRFVLSVTGSQLIRLTIPDDEADGLIIGAGHEGGWPTLL